MSRTCSFMKRNCDRQIGRDLMTSASKRLIKMSTKADAKRDSGLTIPEDIEYIRDLPYGEENRFHSLDVCYPKEVNPIEKIPVIVSVHGGGYVYGSKKVYQFYCADLAKRGFAVVNFNYRLAPYYHFPDPILDIDDVLKWVYDNSKIYPFDTENVFLLGDSAGAQLACQYGVIYTNEEYRKLFDLSLPHLTIRALGLNCGMYDLYKSAKKGGKRGCFKDYFGGEPLKQYGEKLKVLEYLTKDFPPSYILSAKGDYMRVFAEPMAAFLDEKGVENDKKIYGDRKTGHVFHVNVRSDIGREANDDEIAFFKKYLVK